MKITDSIIYVGVNDRDKKLFEGQYPIPDGISYNSYIILDERIAVMDSVDADFGDEWLANVRAVLGDRAPDYLVVSHMEPDHSANISLLAKSYPDMKIVSSAKAFSMMRGFFGEEYADRRIVVSDGSTLSLGEHELSFVTAPMVHWPEVIMSYDKKDKVLFSADAFGKFGVPGSIGEWADEARRYYFGIVGKYGAQVQGILKKVAAFDISVICSLHGPVLDSNIGYYVSLYDKWSKYESEARSVTVAYASVYGNTRRAAEILRDELLRLGTEVELVDLNLVDKSYAIASAFKSSALVLVSVTYNGDVFPSMRGFIEGLIERGYTKRPIGLIENGSWAPMAAKVMRGMLDSARGVEILESVPKIMSAPSTESESAIRALAAELNEKIN